MNRQADDIVGRACGGARWLLYSAVIAWPSVAPADDAAPPVSAGVQRAILLCGHPGDDDHNQLFGESFAKVYRGLTEQRGFRTENVVAFFGANKDDAAALGIPVRGPGLRDELAQAVAELRERLQPADTLWVIVMGHAHFDGRHSWLNLPGPDIHQDDFGRMFRDLQCREQAFFIASPASGYYLKPLSMPGRIVISATEADLEVNETVFPHALADELNPPADKPLEDIDRDGKLTHFDLYIALAKNVAQRYAKEMLLSTEHALLDDNGDGRGTELQLDYLTVEEGGRKRRDFLPTHKPGADGTLSSEVEWRRSTPSATAPQK